MDWPILFGLSGVFAPAQGLAPPTTGDEIQATVPINIHRDGGEIVVVFVVRRDAADLVLLYEVGAFIPVSAADDVRDAVTIDVKYAGGFVALG